MASTINIRKGLNIPLHGEAERVIAETYRPDTFMVRPSDFKGLTPKALVKAGSEVKAGTPLFFSKDQPDLTVASPVSGEVVEVVRGEKRVVLGFKILADKETRFEELAPANITAMSREDVLARMKAQSLLAFVSRRPYGTVARPSDMPKAVFISAFDSAPITADNDFILQGMQKEFQAGVDVLNKLAPRVYLGIHADDTSSEVFKQAKGLHTHSFEGPHPAGNVGVQIHHISPINKGEVVWTVAPQDVVVIGRAFLSGKYDVSRVMALCGSEVKAPKYYRVIQGASLEGLLKGKLNDGKVRTISGNCLTGKAYDAADLYLGFYDKEVTVLPEGDRMRFFATEGWASPGLDKFSMSRSYFSWMMPGRKYRLDTNCNGEERAYVMTGQYEDVFPMDIYPQHLVKAMLVGDIELMENLGVYEVVEEDFALCEYVCTSKQPVQEIVRDALALIEKECG
jgi:Na+-transporting NADH:ubiquinone oxidoreductase subunit A